MTTKRLGVIMNGVTGRMGLNQHLIRSIIAIRDSGGVLLGNGDRMMPDPILVGRDSDKVERLARRFNVERWTTDLDKALLEPSDSIFFDAATTQARPSLLTQAISAGKHVYCEKPIATNLEEAVAVLRLANARGIKHGTVQDKLFLPGLKKLAFLRDSGFFGRMLAVRGEFGYWVFEGDWQEAQRPSWNYRSEDGGGIILDMGCHWRYVLDNLFGEVESVSCLGTTDIPERWDEKGEKYNATADDSAYATFRLKGGVIAHINMSWATRVYRDDLVSFQVDGTHRRAVSAIDLEGHEIVAIDPRRPGHVDVRDHAALEAEGRVGGIVRRRVVLLALLVPALRNIGGAETAHTLDFAKQIVEHVAPVAHHVENDAAAVLAAIIPRRPLRLLPIALEHPVAEFAAHREHSAEKSGIAQECQLLQARQEQLVLHSAVLDALGVGQPDHRHRLFEIGRDRLFAIDVLAGIDRFRQQPRPRLRGRGIEENAVAFLAQRLVEIGGPALHTKLFCKTLELVGVAADQDRVRHHAVAIRKQHAALFTNRDDRADQMLVEPHAASDPIHDHTEPLRRHIACSFGFFVFGCSSGDHADQSGCAPVAKPGVVSDPVRRLPF